eukprot:SAG31_NODE_5004_length_2807_cov_1.624446_4_plen_145_part_00
MSPCSDHLAITHDEVELVSTLGGGLGMGLTVPFRVKLHLRELPQIGFHSTPVQLTFGAPDSASCRCKLMTFVRASHADSVDYETHVADAAFGSRKAARNQAAFGLKVALDHFRFECDNKLIADQATMASESDVRIFRSASPSCT